MDVTYEIMAAGAFSILSAVLGAFVAYRWTTRSEQIALTMKLYDEFYDPDMHAARIDGAQHLMATRGKDTFNTLWESDETVPIYQALTRVVYFWFGMAQLDRTKRLDRPLAKRLFRYPFKYWQPFIAQLHANTVAEGSTDQDWLQLISEDELSWILE